MGSWTELIADVILASALICSEADLLVFHCGHAIAKQEVSPCHCRPSTMESPS